MAWNAGGLDDSLSEGDTRIRNPDLNVAIKQPNIMHNTIQMHLTIAYEHMLTRLLNLRLQQKVAFVCFSNRLDHFGKLAGHQRLNRYPDSRLRPKFQRR